MKTLKTLADLRESFSFEAGKGEMVVILNGKDVLVCPIEIKEVGKNIVTYTRNIKDSTITCTASFSNIATGAELFYDMTVKEENPAERNARNQAVKNLFSESQYIRGKLEQMPDVIKTIIKEMTTKPRKPRDGDRRVRSDSYLYR